MPSSSSHAPSPIYTLPDDGSGPVWAEANTVESAPVHSIVGFGHIVDAAYWSKGGDLIAKIDVRLNGAPSDAVKVGQTIPDQDGCPYVVVEAREHGAGPFAAVEAKAVREDVYLEAMDYIERATKSRKVPAAA